MAAFQWQQRLLRILSRHNRTTILLNHHHHHHHHHLPTPFPPAFSTLEDSFRSGNKMINSSQSILDESHILDQLSDLLPIQRNQPSIPKLLLYAPPDEPPEIRAAAPDEFLAPEDKLRGIFLQKLRGKTAIEHALTNVIVDLTVDVFAKVVNRGNLSGEAMVIFFNWVIKQPEIPENDVHCYNIIVKALGRRKFFNHMMDILHEMNVLGVSPNSETLMIAMGSFVSSRQVSKAIQLFGKLEEIGSKCDTESLNVLLKCLCQRSHVGSASSVLHSIKGKIPFDIMTYNVIIGGWSKFGSVSEMEGILKTMVMDGFNPDCLTFTYLLEGLGRAGQVDDAVQIFDNMKGQGCVPDTNIYNAMIANFISIKDFGECMKYYERILKSDLEPNMETYAKLIAAFLKARRVADALELFDEMLCRGIVPTTGTITSFVEPLCRYGPPHAAMIIYKKARKVGCRISLSAYKLLLMRLSRFGKCGMILSLWNEMQESGYTADIEVYEYVINGLCNIGQLENAVIVMEESLRKGFCPSRLIYSKLNHKLMALNKVDIAYKLFLKIKCARLDENARKYWRYNGWHF